MKSDTFTTCAHSQSRRNEEPHCVRPFSISIPYFGVSVHVWVIVWARSFLVAGHSGYNTFLVSGFIYLGRLFESFSCRWIQHEIDFRIGYDPNPMRGTATAATHNEQILDDRLASMHKEWSSVRALPQEKEPNWYLAVETINLFHRCGISSTIAPSILELAMLAIYYVYSMWNGSWTVSFRLLVTAEWDYLWTNYFDTLPVVGHRLS